ncbi:MAG: hypothetical protein FOGNACKC_02888 [Anaerolineae bacterium]|nr:hypothetical protein [Anaerolineae bacterium]
MEPHSLTTDEVAEKMEVHQDTVSRWIRQGKLKGYREGHRWLVLLDDFASFQAKRNPEKSLKFQHSRDVFVTKQCFQTSASDMLHSGVQMTAEDNGNDLVKPPNHSNQSKSLPKNSDDSPDYNSAKISSDNTKLLVVLTLVPLVIPIGFILWGIFLRPPKNPTDLIFRVAVLQGVATTLTALVQAFAEKLLSNRLSNSKYFVVGLISNSIAVTLIIVMIAILPVIYPMPEPESQQQSGSETTEEPLLARAVELLQVMVRLLQNGAMPTQEMTAEPTTELATESTTIPDEKMTEEPVVEAANEFFPKTTQTPTDTPTIQSSPTSTPISWPPTIPPTATPSPTLTSTPVPRINFWADRGQVKAGECASLYWEVEYVREVYLDEVGVVGQGNQNVCPKKTKIYTLRVIRLDGTAEFRQVILEVLSYPTPVSTSTETSTPTSTPVPITDTPTLIAIPSSTPMPPVETPTPTSTPPPTNGSTATATFTSTPTSTLPPTNSPTPIATPTPIPLVCDTYNADGPLNFGPGDGQILDIEAGHCIDVMLSIPIIGNGNLSPDFVFYERLVPGEGVIYLDWIELQLSPDRVHWVTVFEWGDNDPANTAYSSIAAYGRDEDGEADNEHIPSGDLYGDPISSGILIDIDTLSLEGPFEYLRIISPADGHDPAQIDAIEFLMTKDSTPTSIPTATLVPLMSETSTPELSTPTPEPPTPTPESPTPTSTPTPEPPTPTPESPTPTSTPTPEPPTPTPESPTPTSTPTPEPPTPTSDEGDHNRGHGNDDDHNDEDNPGQGKGDSS